MCYSVRQDPLLQNVTVNILECLKSVILQLTLDPEGVNVRYRSRLNSQNKKWFIQTYTVLHYILACRTHLFLRSIRKALPRKFCSMLHAQKLRLM